MSFSLFTASSVDDVPKILTVISRNYRGSQTKYYPNTWLMIADEVEKFAKDLVTKIEESKLLEPKPRKSRVKLK